MSNPSQDELINMLMGGQQPQRKSPFDDVNMEALGKVIRIIEAVEEQSAILEMHQEVLDAGVPTCPAVEGYKGDFPGLLQAATKAVEAISAFAETQYEELNDAFELYRNKKYTSMANCERPDCPDRDNARRELGWNQDKPPLAQ